jgi:hypothetical protein
MIPKLPALYHFSDFGNIKCFRPRPPLRHPDSEPLVYAIDAWHAPLYFFPRDCPRIALWPVPETKNAEGEHFANETSARMLIYIEAQFELDWRQRDLYRYEMNPEDGFIDTGDIGVWISRQPVLPIAQTRIFDLPAEAHQDNVEVRVVNSLVEMANKLHDFEHRRFLTSLHVSMIRTSLLPNWPKLVEKKAYHRTHPPKSIR